MTDGRTIVVTGSSRGIGAAIRDRLQADGHRVIGVSREPGPPAAGYHPVSIDLSGVENLAETLRPALARFPEIDALVSNAGGPVFGNLEQISPRDIRAAVDLNLTSHLLVAHTLLPILKTHATSDVIIIGSEASLKGGRRGSVYCAAKFGLRGFAQSLRQECAASGVRVTLINPGMARTDFFDGLDFTPGEDPENAIDPGDVADAVTLVLRARAGTVFDEIQLTPLKHVVRARKDRSSPEC